MAVPQHRSFATLQNVNSPDFDLNRDIVSPALAEEILLGMEAGELASEAEAQKRGGTENRFQVNLATILISALIFLAILAWFDFIQTTFFVWLSPEVIEDTVPPSVKFWYAILCSIVVIILVILIYYHFYEFVR